MLPALAVTNPARSCSARARRTALAAPRILNDAIGWSVSSFSQISASRVGLETHERRAHGDVGDPLARRLDLLDCDHSSTSVPSPSPRALLTASSAAAMSSIARPSERNSVISRGLVRPGRNPAATSPSVARTCDAPSMRPSSMAQAILARLVLERLAAVAEQRRGGDRRRVELARRRRAGADRVDVRALGQPRTLEDRLARVGGGDHDVGVAHRVARAGGDLDAQSLGVCACGRIDAHAVEVADEPQRAQVGGGLDPGAEDAPASARPRAPSSRVASADTAAVRISVIADASRIELGTPVSPSKSVTVPWWASRPRLGLPGKMQTALSENSGRAPPRCAGISPINPSEPGGTLTERSGWWISPRACAPSTAAIASMHSSIGSARATSAWPRTSAIRRRSSTARRVSPRRAGVRAPRGRARGDRAA